MHGQVLENVIMFSRNYLKNFIKKDWTCIDATLGHGNDLLFMSDLIGPEGLVYGFDIQEDAIESTEELMKSSGKYSNYQLFHCGHESMDSKLVGPINFIMFNLGYLPKGNKSITTKKETTLLAAKKSLELLCENGLLWLVIYPGHSSGAEEARTLEKFLKNLDQKKYSVMKFEMMNQINSPPYILGVEKKY